MPNESRRDFFKAAGGGLLAAEGALGQSWRLELTMKPEDAVRYVVAEINPILKRVVNNPNYIPGIRNRLIEQFKLTVPNGKMINMAVGGVRPDQPNMIAHIDYDVRQKKPILMIFVPAMQKYKRDLEWSGYRQEDIDTIIALILAHEQVHYQIDEVQGKYPMINRVNRFDIELDAREEAEAWGITITEMIRPALQRGIKLPPDMIQNSEQYKIVGNNFQDPRWIAAFRSDRRH